MSVFWGYYSNVFGVIGGAITLLAIAWGWWHLRCRVVRCLRPGKHAVAGTTWKVCSNHHTLAHHRRLYRRHQQHHPERLGHGQSHDLDTPAEQADILSAR